MGDRRVVDPMGRSLLFNEAVNSLLFFAVFFVHMLVPIALAIVLWLHLARVSRAHFLTKAPMTVWTLGMLLLVSVAFPAQVGPPADLTALGQSFSMDWWYLMPLVLTDRLSGGALWSLALVVGPALAAFPLWMTTGRPEPAEVDVARCNECMQCYQDCPFEAISMIPRDEENPRYALEASVDPSRCVGCGICSGSCDSIAINQASFHVREQRAKVEGWLLEAKDAGEELDIAYSCVNSAGGTLSVDSETGLCADLPGYRVLELPCAAWLNPLTIERALRRGARRAVIISCGPECHYREGPEWLEMRLDGRRNPSLRTKFVNPADIHMLPLDHTRGAELRRTAAELRSGASPSPERPASPLLAGVTFVAAALVAAAVVGWISDLDYTAPRVSGSQLVVTFKHPGHVSEDCRELSEAEKAARPVHMRQDTVCERARADVRLIVSLDGETILSQSYHPAGLWSDLNSLAVEELAVSPGEHTVGIKIGDSPDPDAWAFSAQRTLEFTEDKREVVAFDRLAGFTWH